MPWRKIPVLKCPNFDKIKFDYIESIIPVLSLEVYC